jgi:septum formation topological specificity factor MinE
MRGGAGPQPPFGPNPDNLREHDPEMIRLTQREQELDRKSRDLSDQLRRGRNVGADQKEQIKKQLADVVSRHFDVRQERRELELKRMEDEIERLRATVKSYREKREAAVQRRLSQLMDVDDLDF